MIRWGFWFGFKGKSKIEPWLFNNVVHEISALRSADGTMRSSIEPPQERPEFQAVSWDTPKFRILIWFWSIAFMASRTTSFSTHPPLMEP